MVPLQAGQSALLKKRKHSYIQIHIHTCTNRHTHIYIHTYIRTELDGVAADGPKRTAEEEKQVQELRDEYDRRFREIKNRDRNV